MMPAIMDMDIYMVDIRVVLKCAIFEFCIEPTIFGGLIASEAIFF